LPLERLLVSLKRRTFSIAITAWAAKVLSSAISFSETCPVAAALIAPIGFASRIKGTDKMLRKPIPRAVIACSWLGITFQGPYHPESTTLCVRIARGSPCRGRWPWIELP
jgi:hypothetical protein